MTKSKSGERKFYGFVEGVVPADPDRQHSRRAILLDCVDAASFDATAPEELGKESFFLARTLTTVRKWDEDLLLPDLKESEWVEFTIENNQRFPRAWLMPASNNYVPLPSTNLMSMVRIADTGEPTGRGRQGSPLDQRLKWASQRLRGRARTVVGARDLLSLARERLGRAKAGTDITVRALDVGQAACVAVMVNDEVVFFFDVGAPLFLNQKSFPTSFSLPRIASDAIVLLSHWDFDHFDLARRYPQLLKLKWYAPNQPVGHNTALFQAQLGKKLNFLNGSFGRVGGRLSLAMGSSPQPRDRNGTGLHARLEVGSEIVVLTGDVDYAFMNPHIASGATAMMVPHHGGKGTSPPAAAGKSLAVASYGKPNRHRHPNEPYLSDHVASGWTVQRTAAHNHKRRGPRLLFP